MSNYIPFKLALVLFVLVAIAIVDCGPLASPAIAQRSGSDNDDERRADDRRGDDREGGGDRDWRRGRGRGGWGRPRGNDDNEGERRNRGQVRNRNDDDERANKDRGNEGDSGMDVAAWARELVKQNDKNGDMMLQEDERSKLRGPAAGADRDGDNVITVEEIVGSLSERRGAGRGGRDGERPRGRENTEGSSDTRADKSQTTANKRVYTSLASGAAKEAPARRSYRFTPATERLTGDLPSWFKSRDRNKDGQVSMSEYSRSWTERLVREFQRYDRNNDGVVTAKEAAQ